MKYKYGTYQKCLIIPYFGYTLWVSSSRSASSKKNDLALRSADRTQQPMQHTVQSSPIRPHRTCYTNVPKLYYTPLPFKKGYGTPVPLISEKMCQIQECPYQISFSFQQQDKKSRKISTRIYESKI